MSEEVKQEESKEQESIQEVSEVELQAQSLGWQPKEEFEADPKNKGKTWRPAEDFIDRKSFFDKIEHSNREIRNLKKALQTLAEHNQKIEKASYEKAIRELKEDRDKALEEQDLVKAEKLRDTIDEIKDKMKTQPQPQISGTNVNFEEWNAKNTWYNTDQDMRIFADGYAIQLWNSGIREPTQALEMIERKVRESFAHKFKNPGKNQMPGLESSTRKDPKKQDDFQMTDEEKKILDTMLRAGAPITREEYIKQLKMLRG